MYICVHVIPNAKKEMIEIIGENSYGHTVYKIKTIAPAIKGKANETICQMLAGYLNKKISDVTLVKGHMSRDKTFYIS